MERLRRSGEQQRGAGEIGQDRDLEQQEIGELVVEVGPDRVVRQPGSPNFAGSALTMDAAVHNAIACRAMTLAEAWRAASPNVVGRNRDVLVLDEGSLRVRAVLRRGKRPLF